MVWKITWKLNIFVWGAYSDKLYPSYKNIILTLELPPLILLIRMKASGNKTGIIVNNSSLKLMV